MSFRYFSSVQLSRSLMSNSATPWIAALQASLSITKSQSLLKLMPIQLVMPSNHLVLWNSLAFSPKYWSFSFSISPSNENSGLIFLQIDWFYLLTVQGTFRNLLQHHSLKASSLRCSAFFMVHLSQPYMTTGKTTTQTSVSRVISLLFNTLSRFVIAFLPRSNHHHLQSPSTVILEPPKIKLLCFPIYLP